MDIKKRIGQMDPHLFRVLNKDQFVRVIPDKKGAHVTTFGIPLSPDSLHVFLGCHATEICVLETPLPAYRIPVLVLKTDHAGNPISAKRTGAVYCEFPGDLLILNERYLDPNFSGLSDVLPEAVSGAIMVEHLTTNRRMVCIRKAASQDNVFWSKGVSQLFTFSAFKAGVVGRYMMQDKGVKAPDYSRFPQSGAWVLKN